MPISTCVAVTLVATALAQSRASMWSAGESGGAWIAVCAQRSSAAPAVVDAAAELRHRLGHGHVHRRQRGAAARRPDAVVELLERARGAGDGDDVVGGGERLGKCGAEAARGAGDEGYGAWSWRGRSLTARVKGQVGASLDLVPQD